MLWLAQRCFVPGSRQSKLSNKRLPMPPDKILRQNVCRIGTAVCTLRPTVVVIMVEEALVPAPKG